MLEKFYPYFEVVQLPQPFIERLEAICSAYSPVFEGLEILSVFASDFFEPEGARRFTSLWLVTSELVMEIKDFPTSVSIDFTPLKQISYVEFARSDLQPYDGETTPQNTLTAVVRFGANLEGQFSAAHNNCKYLLDFLDTYLVPY